VQRYYWKAKKGNVAQVDTSLIVEAVAAINVPTVQSLGVSSQPPIKVMDRSSMVLRGGGVSVAQPSSGGVGPAFSYPFGVVGFSPSFQWVLFPPRPFSSVYGCSPQFLLGMS
jgi:hypothetical protein